jgi:acylphosphatase
MARHYIVRGRVQGVGFRYFVARQARALELIGWVRNLPDGSVEASAAGSEEALENFERALREGPRMSRVDAVHVTITATPTVTSFEIIG